MGHETYMRLAIAEAKKSRQKGGAAIGAVLVNDTTGKVFTRGESLVAITNDPTSHAEINCIRAACAKLATDHLTDYALYCTLEPCHMCLGAATWARVATIYFGAYRKDVAPILFDTIKDKGDEQEATNMNLNGTAMHVRGGILETECAQLLNNG